MRSLCIFVLAFGATLDAQRTIVVTGGGNALQQAVTQANAGDTLDVRPGWYDRIKVSKGIAILCSPGVTLDGGFNSHALRVTALPAGETFVLRGGSYYNISVLTNAAVAVDHCCGRIILDALESFTLLTGAPLSIEHCTGPVLLRRFKARLPFPGTHSVIRFASNVSITASPVLPPLRICEVNLCLTDCSVMGSTGVALHADHSVVSITGGKLEGAFSQTLGVGYPAITLWGTSLSVAGGARLSGGKGAGPAITSTWGHVRLAPSVTLTGTSPVIRGIVPVHESVPSVLSRGVAPGALLKAQVEAEAGSSTVTLIGHPVEPVFTPFGHLWLDPTSSMLDLRCVPSSGAYSLSIPLPLLPPRLALGFQTLSLTAAGKIIIGTASRVVLE